MKKAEKHFLMKKVQYKVVMMPKTPSARGRSHRPPGSGASKVMILLQIKGLTGLHQPAKIAKFIFYQLLELDNESLYHRTLRR